MASQTLRVGIVGAGRVARVHAKALEHVDGAEIVAISDPALERAEALAGELGAAAYADHRELLEGCDALWICSPPTTHLQQVSDAAEAGCHVMLEKPIATTVEDCLGMIEAVERAGVKTIVDFNNRFRWPFQFMRDAIAAGEIGELLSIWSHRIGPSPSTLGTTWRQDPRLLSGFTIESLSHDIDHILWMAGPATAVSGSVSSSMPELPQFDNTMGAFMHLASGATAQLHASWAATVAAGQRGALGTRGTILLEGDSIWTISRVRMRTTRDDAEQVFELGGLAATDMGYCALAEHFVECIREDREPQPGLRAGLAALDVSLGVLAASRERSVVTLPERG